MPVLEVWTGSEWKKVGCGTPDPVAVNTFTDSTPGSGNFTRRTNIGAGWQWGTVTSSVDNNSTARVVLGFSATATSGLAGGIVCELNDGPDFQLNIRRNGIVIASQTLGPESDFANPPFTIEGWYNPDTAEASVSLLGHPLAATLTAASVVPPTTAGGSYVLYGQVGATTASFVTATIEALEPGTGRLYLWDGTQWVREVCDGETGVPLQMWDGAAFVTVACMTPA